MNRGSSWVVLAAATVTVLLGPLSDLVSNTIALPSGWQIWLWVLMVFLAVAAIVLALRLDRAAQRSAAAESTPPRTPPTTGRLFVGKPPRRAGAFQNRQALLDDMGAESVVLCGMGGAGKTQLAAEHARRAWESGEIDALLWIDAASRDKVLSGLSKAAEEMFGAGHRDPDQVLSWLATHQRWLVVFDDLRDPEDLFGLWPPHTRYGQVVVTTRYREAAISARFIEVEPFAPEEAVAFLSERLAARPGQAAGAAALADALGYLPQGLAQAATKIANHPGLTCATYHGWFDDLHHPLSRLRPDRLPDDQRHPIEASWSSSIDHANRSAPQDLARALLALLALLDHAGVPETVLTSLPALTYLRRTGRAVNAETAKDALSCLHRFSLLTYAPDDHDRTVRIHPLVQRAVYDTLTWRGITKAARAAANALSQAWPETELDSTRSAVLRDNVTALRRTAGAHLWHRRAQAVLFRAGHSLGESGQATAAQDYFQELVDLAREERGYRNLTTLRARAGLAHWQGEAGDPAGAAATLANVLRDARRTCGRKRPFMLKARRSYARWRTDAGEPVSATELNELVDDFRRAFGPNDLNTLYARNIRARHLADADAGTELVDAFLRHCGPDHPDTLSARNNLAVTYAKTGDTAGAATAFTELLDDVRRVFGPDHPNTLRTLNNLARCDPEAGDAP
jgi:hypothetical protein